MSKIVITVIMVALGILLFAVFINDSNRFIDDCIASGKYERFECEMLNSQRFNNARNVTVYNR